MLARLRKDWQRHAGIVMVLACIITAAAFYVLGHERGYVDAATAFRLQYGGTLNAQRPLGRAVAVPYTAPPAQSSATIPVSQQDPVGNQGFLGQCQCYAWVRQFDHLVTKRLGIHRRLSCRFLYALAGHGADNGSDFDQYGPLLALYGSPTHKQYPYLGVPNTPELTYPPPGFALTEALPHRYATKTHVISMLPGGGVNVLNAIEQEIVSDHMVNFVHPVFDGVGSDGDFQAADPGAGNPGIIDIPGPLSKPGLDGLHAITIVGYNRSLCVTTNAGPTCGVFCAVNQWQANWSFYNRSCAYTSTGPAGAVLVTFRFAETYGSGLESLRLTSQAPQAIKPPPANGPPGRMGVKAPVEHLPPVTVSRGEHWVYHVWAKDRFHYDLAPSINYWSHAHRLDPVGVLATLLNECGGYTHSARCDRDVSPADASYGDCQVTIGTAYWIARIGNGQWDGLYGRNRNLVRGYENGPRNCHWLGTKVLGQYAAYERFHCSGAASFPNLYVAWNAGPGQPCWFLLSPSGQAGSAYQNFLVWYRDAWTYGRIGTDPYRR